MSSTPHDDLDIIDVGDLIDGRRPFEARFAGHTVSGVYDPNRFTNQFSLRISKMMRLSEDDPRRLEFGDAVVTSFVVEWNLWERFDPASGEAARTKEERQAAVEQGWPKRMWPITAENVASLALPLRSAISTAIMADVTGSADLGKSPAGSSAPSEAPALDPTQNGAVHPAGSSFSVAARS